MLTISATFSTKAQAAAFVPALEKQAGYWLSACAKAEQVLPAPSIVAKNVDMAIATSVANLFLDWASIDVAKAAAMAVHASHGFDREAA